MPIAKGRELSDEVREFLEGMNITVATAAGRRADIGSLLEVSPERYNRDPKQLSLQPTEELGKAWYVVHKFGELAVGGMELRADEYGLRIRNCLSRHKHEIPIVGEIELISIHYAHASDEIPVPATVMH